VVTNSVCMGHYYTARKAKYVGVYTLIPTPRNLREEKDGDNTQFKKEDLLFWFLLKVIRIRMG